MLLFFLLFAGTAERVMHVNTSQLNDAEKVALQTDDQGHYYLWQYDSYYYLWRSTTTGEDTKGELMPVVGRIITFIYWSFTGPDGFDLHHALAFVPVLVSLLATLFLYWLVKEYTGGDIYIAFAISLLFTTSGTVLNNTYFGYFDTDSFIILFSLLVAGYSVFVIEDSPGPAWFLGLLPIGLLFRSVWNGWFYIFLVIALSIAAWLFFKRPLTRMRLACGIVLSLCTAAFVVFTYSGKILSYLNLGNPKMQYIAEMQGSFGTAWHGGIGHLLIITIFLVLVFNRQRYLHVLLVVWSGVMFISAGFAQRHLLYLQLPIYIMGGLIIQRTFSLNQCCLTKKIRPAPSVIFAGVITILVIISAPFTYISAKHVYQMSDAVQPVSEWLRDHDSTMLAWWDLGHVYRAHGVDIRWDDMPNMDTARKLARLHLAGETEACSIFRSLAQGQENPVLVIDSSRERYSHVYERLASYDGALKVPEYTYTADSLMHRCLVGNLSTWNRHCFDDAMRRICVCSCNSSGYTDLSNQSFRENWWGVVP